MRDYQQECVEIIEYNFKKFDRQLIQLPTGAGKTWVFCKYLKKNSDSALIICPSIELKQQIFDTCKLFDIRDVSFNIHDTRKNHVVTTHSLCFEKNLEVIKRKQYQNVIIDEAHHSHSPTYKKFLKYTNPSTKILGCTATPERLDGKNLLDIFERLTYHKNIYDLVNAGYLADIEAYRIKTQQKIAKRANDFRSVELRLLDNDQRNNIIINTFMENCTDKKTLIFCLNIEHSLKIAQTLRKKNIKSAYVHGKMKRSERKDVLSKFKNGEIQVVTNCQILTEGFDEPSIEALMITRPTASKSLYCQMIGRGLRKTESKNICYLYELADNNHNICNFNVISGNGENMSEDYPQHSRLTKTYRERQKEEIVLEDLSTCKHKFNLFINDERLRGNTFNILQSKYYYDKPTEHQLFILKELGIFFNEDINFLEAAFMIWKSNLMRKYGIN